SVSAITCASTSRRRRRRLFTTEPCRNSCQRLWLDRPITTCASVAAMSWPLRRRTRAPRSSAMRRFASTASRTRQRRQTTDGLTAFGALAVTAMLVGYALEDRTLPVVGSALTLFRVREPTEGVQ